VLPPGLLAQILTASRSIHRSGSMSPAALIALAKHLENGVVENSAETGTGASTILFSHLSRRHTTFTVNTDESMSTMQSHPLLNPQTVAFVEGPTQKTLPAHSFPGPLQAVLIDGPHAYPFPELEYFYLYPRLVQDGLLVIDDIHIPSIQNLFRFVSADEMFRVVEVSGKTAFLRRTAAPMFDPWGDGWWLQRYNRRTLWRYSYADKLKSMVPAAVRPVLRRLADRIRLGD
jgi:hypothetical protein